ncbi:hypothetical protein [Coleofasciculus sp. FACHB-SPT9]|uniref:hypothetical protein n=1 Tax=Cyanophyceae TaxID=3028117 RepID=UPI001684F8E2|nr:hypothetical protein [Coleofasciculus sp. FACHB-SPT9]MBD1890903.1 hypothetical protein [Coleofasciculus sp. FACHB-SPT9]
MTPPLREFQVVSSGWLTNLCVWLGLKWMHPQQQPVFRSIDSPRLHLRSRTGTYSKILESLAGRLLDPKLAVVSQKQASSLFDPSLEFKSQTVLRSLGFHL